MSSVSRPLLAVVSAIAIVLTSLTLTLIGPAQAAVAPGTNPDLQPKCGLSIALILDSSGSINSAGAVEKVRGAANALLSSLAGTGSSASVVQFGTVAQQDAGYSQVTAASLAAGGAHGQALAKYYNPQPPLGARAGHRLGSGSFTSTSSYTNDTSAGWTNWEDALLKTRAVPGAPGGKADLVVFITDGDPTAVNTQPGYPFYNSANPTGNVLTNISGSNQDRSLDPAITAANAIKAAGSKILTVGVGNGLTSADSQTRLKQVSGPDLTNLDTGGTLNLATDDVVVTTSFDKLATAAGSIATELCQSSLTITKKAQSASSNAYQPVPDWQFAVTPTVTGGSLTGWIAPAGASGASASATTDAQGRAAFQWKLSSASATASLRVQETGRTGFTFGAAACTIRSLGGGVTNTTYTSNPFTIPALKSTDIVTCEVTNDFIYNPAITLDKTAAPTEVRTDASPPTQVTYTYVARNTGNTPLSNVQLTDNRCTSITGPTGDSNGDGRLDTSETWQFRCTQAFDGVTTPNVVNTATIRGTDPAGTGVQATDSATVRTYAPAISLTKTPSRTNIAPNGAVTYTYVARNVGNVALTGVTVADDRCSPVTPASVASLAVGATANFTCTTTLAQTTVNTATATGTPPLGPPVTATATATVTVTPVGVDLTKSANGVAGTNPAPVHEGDTVTYTFVVRLPAGAAALDDVELADPGCSPITGPTGDAGTIGRLEQGETWTYTCTITSGAATPDLLPNTATVTGSPVGPGGTVTDTDTAVVQVLRPAINVLKAATPTLIHGGDQVTYSYGVTNPGNTPLTVNISDDKCAPLTFVSGDSNVNGRLDINETWLYTCRTALADDTTNTVTATGTDSLGRQVVSTDTADVVVLNPAIVLEKSVDRTVIRFGPDNLVTYTLTARNTGDADLAAITFTDDTCSVPVITGGDANGDGVMNPGETWTATCSARLDASTTNTATVAGTDALGRDVTAEDDVRVTVIDPRLRITKTPSRDVVRTGDTVTYTYLATNTGNTVLTDVRVSDNVCAPVTPASVASLAVGASTTFTCAMPLVVTTSNFATVTGTAPDGLPVLDSAAATVEVRNPSVSVAKSADKTVVDPGGSVTYSYLVTNTGDTPLGPVTVTDDACSPVTPASVATLAPEAATTFTCTTTLDADTVNTAVVSAEVPIGGDPVTDTDQETVDVVPSGIEVSKSVDTAVIRSGATVVYTYEVSNPGEGPLSAVTVTDDFCSPVTYASGDTNTDGRLDTSETWTYTCTTSVAVDTINTATASGTTPGGGTVTDTDTEFVDVIFPSISLTKSVAPTIIRPGESVTYTITITNDGDVPLVIPAGAPVDDRCDELTVVEGGLQDNILQVGESLVVQCSAQPTESVTNTAIVDAEDPLGNPLNDSGLANVDIQDPRLTVEKTADQTAVNAGDTVTYTIDVTNTGAPNSPLTNVRVVDDKCTGLTGPVVVTGNDDDILNTGETWRYTCTAVITEGTVNTVVVTGTPTVGPDVESTDTETVRIKQVDVVVRKTTTTPIVSVGDEATFVIEVGNAGPDDATGVVVTDVLEDGMTFISADPAAEYDGATGTWTVGNLAMSQVKTLTLVASVDAAAPVLTNVATRTATTEEDTNPDNDESSAGVVQESTLELAKTADPETVKAGESTTFTVTVTNAGPSKATGTVVNDKLPTGLVFVSSEASLGSYDAATGVWSVGDLDALASATLTIKANVPVAGEYRNVATATSDQQDPDREPEAEATVTATPPPAPPTPPTPPPSGGGGGGIPGTGANGTVWLLIAAIILLAVGGGTVWATRKRKQT